MNIQSLELVSGYAMLKADTPEPVEIIDLLGGVIRVAVEGAVSGWTPAYAALKNSGIWNDSPLLDGRQLTAAANGNVIETLSCVATGLYAARAAAIARLMRFAQAARRFSTDDAAYRPVYLRWWAAGAPADQYALIYNIEVDVQQDPFGAADSNLLTLTIEREPFWRGLAPGDTPLAGASLFSGTVYNAYEDNAGSFRGNWVEFAPSAIKGDAETLPYISFLTPIVTTAGMSKLYIAKSTLPDLQAKVGGVRLRASLPGYEASAVAGTVTTPTHASGLLDTTATRRVLQMQNASTARWQGSRLNQFANKYLVFVRGLVTAGTLATAALSFSTFGNPNNIVMPVPLTTSIGMRYCGILDPNALVFGMNTVGGISTAALLVDLAITGTVTLQVWDIMLIPFDEQAMMINIPATSGPNQIQLVIDQTQFLSGGKPIPQIALMRESGRSGAFEAVNVQVSGSPLTLTPNRYNRLYFVFETTSTNAADMIANSTVTISAVSRWHGIRDG